MRIKKKVIVIFVSILLIILLSLIAFYFYSMTPISKNSEEVTFEVKPGTSKINIAENLEKAKLIHSKTTLKLYLFFNNDLNLQAGIYALNRNMKPEEMIKKIEKGEVKNEAMNITLVEGKRLTSYFELIANQKQVSQDDFINQMKDPIYLQKLMDTYWFLDDSILNPELYYPLEGYIFPDTYTFYELSTPSEIIEKILDHTKTKLDPLKEKIENSGYTTHQILSAAAIIELEALTEIDRQTVSQVIKKRLNLKMGLGMDVTTYYAVKKEMGSGLSLKDLQSNSPFNTSESNPSNAGKLPVGPICSPSLMSINAFFNPSETDYLYFYADIKTGKVYFTNTYEEHLKVIKEVG